MDYSFVNDIIKIMGNKMRLYWGDPGYRAKYIKKPDIQNFKADKTNLSQAAFVAGQYFIQTYLKFMLGKIYGRNMKSS